MVTVAYNGTSASALTAEHFDMDDITLSLQIPHSGKTVHHIFQKRVYVNIGAESRPRQEQITSQPARGLQAFFTCHGVEIRLQYTFKDLGPQQTHEEVSLFPFLTGHSVRQCFGHISPPPVCFVTPRYLRAESYGIIVDLETCPLS